MISRVWNSKWPISPTHSVSLSPLVLSGECRTKDDGNDADTMAVIANGSGDVVCLRCVVEGGVQEDLLINLVLSLSEHPAGEHWSQANAVLVVAVLVVVTDEEHDHETSVAVRLIAGRLRVA